MTTVGIEKEKQTAWLSAKPEEATNGKKRQHFLPNVDEVPPNGSMVSEQPEISELAKLKKDMHTLNAKRGTAFASQSERASLSKVASPPAKRKQLHSDVTHETNSDEEDDGNEEDDDEDADEEEQSSLKDSILKRHFSPQPHLSPVVSNKKKVTLAETHTTVPITPTKKQDEKKDSVPWFQRVQGFFKKNIMVVLALVVLLIFCGVSMYLFIKTKIETKKRNAERAETQVVIEQEQALPRRDAALEQLRAEKAALQITNEQTRATLDAYAKQLNEAKDQSEQQMEMLEQLAYLNQQYEDHLQEQAQTLARQQEEYDALLTSMNDQFESGDASATEEEKKDEKEEKVLERDAEQDEKNKDASHADVPHENVD